MVSIVQSLPVSRFEWCSCFGVRHLEVETFDVPLESGRAAAISYGIGDYDRQSRLIGHRKGDAGLELRLVLGGEWDVGDVQASLVYLSKQHHALWIDQYSIPQDPVLIPIHLKAMPEIYRTFEVRVLMPNGPCQCLKTALDSYLAGEDYIDKKDGSFNRYRVVEDCLYAIPVASYNFRLWTKQEFIYARSIAMYYASPPPYRCSRGQRRWGRLSSKLAAEDELYLSGWARWKYVQCSEALDHDFAAEETWSTFRQAREDGIDHLDNAITGFYMRKDIDSFLADFVHHMTSITKFILGEVLVREKTEVEDMIIFENMKSAHKASVAKDFVLAVMPALPSYQVPDDWNSMNLPALLDDGLNQYEDQKRQMQISQLPQGLFDVRAASMRCKPSLYLDTNKISDLGHVYGALRSSEYHALLMKPIPHVMLKLRAGSHTPRLASSMTYKAAFGSKSSDEAQTFMRRVAKPLNYTFGRSYTSSGSLEAWAAATIRGDLPTPEKWPSEAHETVIFTEMLHARQRGWGDLPEVDHERICFDLMCDHTSIHPDVARAKGLGLVVKLDDPPCIAFMYGPIYNAMRQIEDHQATHGSPLLEERTRDNSILPEDWLSLLVTTVQPVQSRFLVLECLKLDKPFDPAMIDEPPREQSVPMYIVKASWCMTDKDDPAIGADLCRSWSKDCNAILV